MSHDQDLLVLIVRAMGVSLEDPAARSAPGKPVKPNADGYVVA